MVDIEEDHGWEDEDAWLPPSHSRVDRPWTGAEGQAATKLQRAARGWLVRHMAWQIMNHGAT
eukprot:3199154-Alexandrium_andersonii.AAC.1